MALNQMIIYLQESFSQRIDESYFKLNKEKK